MARLELFFQDNRVAVGSGFLWRRDEKHYLVTAWHNLTGTHPESGQSISPKGIRPDRMRAYFLCNRIGTLRYIEIPLYDLNGAANWLVHPDAGPLADIAAMSVDGSVYDEGSIAVALNDHCRAPISVLVGGGAYIIGYPLGLSHGGTPIWKRGTIATEPDLAAAPEGNHRMLIDTATREGMSGAPVLIVADGQYQTEMGLTVSPGRHGRFLGVYSGRVASTDAMEAQLGIVRPAQHVAETILSGVRDDFTLNG